MPIYIPLDSGDPSTSGVPLQDLLETAAAQPKDSTAGPHRVVSHSLRELIELSEYLGEKEAMTRPSLPIRQFRVRSGRPV